MAARSLSVAGALGAVVALTLTGCALTAQVTTGKHYSASDGTGATVGGVVAQNLLLITTGEGKPAALVGAVYNSENTDASVKVTVAEDSVSFTVPAMSTVTVGLDKGDQELITDSPVAPGLLSEVTISVANADSSIKPLPVMDGTLSEYKAVLDELATAGK